jgi:rhamnogalacturonan endolyase
MRWGDSYGNRCDRFLACVAYLDGKHASAVFCRGYYTRSVLAAWDFDGKRLTSRWVFDTQSSDTLRAYAGQGNHNLRVADVDADGCDEIIYGAMVVDHDGHGLYSTRMGHGDALHLMPFFPDDPRLQVWSVHENKRDGSVLRDAATGRILFQLPSQSDVGRGMAADIDPRYPGVEMWSSASGGLLTNRGERIAQPRGLPVNFAVWWDGDLLREMLDRARVSKYDWRTERCNVLLDVSSACAFNNGTKSNPCLSADILGDWREEIVVRTHDSSALRIYLTTIPTTHRITCLMQDIPYRLSVATENVGYNQPPETGFYLGETTVWE